MKRKSLTTLLVLILSFSISHAQKPEPVYSIVKQLNNFDWFYKQANLWNDIIKKDSSNAEAWYNYYVANRMANMTGSPDKWDQDSQGVLKDLAIIVEQMAKHIPESFEYNHVVWWNGGNNPEFFPYLKKAYEIDPTRPETYDDMITYYELHNNQKEVEKFCKLWYESGDVSPGVLKFNYNMMQSMEENAIVLVNGDNDTYHKWILQHVKGIRKDVTVLNISLLFVEDYQNSLFKSNNIQPFGKKVEDYYSDEIKESGNYQLMYNNYQLALIEHVLDNAGDRPVYFACTLPHKIQDNFENELYLEGLAFRYSKTRYDNLAYLKKNVEQRFLLDHLEYDFSNDMSLSVMENYNMNYLLAFSNLYEHYKISGDEQKADDIKRLMLNIAEKLGKEEEIANQLN